MTAFLVRATNRAFLPVLWRDPDLRMPGNIMPRRLPPYAPELNPVENVWALLRSNNLANRVCNTHDAILDACADARNWLISQPNRINAIASRPWAQASQ